MPKSLRQLVRLPLKLGFFEKITAYIILISVLTGTVSTFFAAYQFRREMYRLEYDNAFTVYAATISYLSAHYHRHQTFIPRSLDYVLGERFLRIEHSDHTITHRPLQVTVFDPTGEVLYDFIDEPTQQAASPMAPGDLPSTAELEHARFSNVIRVAGPLTSDEDTYGYLVLWLATGIHQQLAALLYQSLLILLVVVAVTMLLAALLTRQVLAPIRHLTQAARAVHQGDLKQNVPVSTDDEIGELATTFNEMVGSMERRISFMHRMQEWTMRIGHQLDAQRLFETLGQMFERMSMADSYRLYLQDPDTERLMVRLEQGPEGLPPEDNDSLTQLALKERWTIYLKSDGTANNEPGDVSELAIPLLSGKHRVGAIRIGRKSDRSTYDDETLTILQTLAQHASVAIDNANLYERLAAQERMAQEMTLARQIQQSMLPREAPEIDGYDVVGGSAPALEVGGDYFDYVARNGHYYLLIGDVSGKGVPAALIMSIVRALIHTYSEFEASPERVLRSVNRNISQDLDPEMFVTLSNLQLNPKTHELLVARAGHEPVLIVHANGAVENLTPPGTALGMLETEDFDALIKEQSYPLQANDTVLLYTDGITEAQNQDHEEFGYERLEKLVCANAALSARELYERIIDEIHAFTSGMAQLDDITLMVIRRNAQ